MRERGIDIYGIMDVEAGIAGHGKFQKSSSSSSTAATSIMKWKWLKQKSLTLKLYFAFAHTHLIHYVTQILKID